MATNLINRFLQGSTNERLRRELLTIVHSNQDTADRLIAYEKRNHPGHTDQWYLEKVIYNLRR